MVAKVSWLQEDKVIESINAKDIGNASGSTIYYENKDTVIADVASNDTTTVNEAKKSISQQALAGLDGVVEIPNGPNYLKTSKNISFANDSTVYQEIVFENDLTTSSFAKKATLSVPAGVDLKSQTDGQKSDFANVFVAPTEITGAIKDNLSETVKNVDTIIKVGDIDNSLLTAEDDNGNSVPFTLTIQTEDGIGKDLNVYSSQDGITRTFFTGTKVKTDGDINYVKFDVPHLTYYAVTTLET